VSAPRLVGTLGVKTLDAVLLGLLANYIEQAGSHDVYIDARERMIESLERIGLNDLVIPETKQDYLAQADVIGTRTGQQFQAERRELTGEVAALPVHFLTGFAVQACAQLAFHREMNELTSTVLEESLDDLGIDRDVIVLLTERACAAELVRDEDGVLRVRQGDLFAGAVEFVNTVLERFNTEVADQRDAGALLEDLRAQVGAFREEFRVDGLELERALEESHGELADLFSKLRAALGEAGCAPEDARALIEDDPERLWSRILRWTRGKEARDAAEAALWAALESAPGGAKVRLGTRIAHVIRSGTR
jgi:hypothetical protein